jgi:hypothetical protein
MVAMDLLQQAHAHLENAARLVTLCGEKPDNLPEAWSNHRLAEAVLTELEAAEPSERLSEVRAFEGRVRAVLTYAACLQRADVELGRSVGPLSPATPAADGKRTRSE